MKVLQIVNDANTGGAQQLIVNLATELRSQGIATDILVLMGPGPFSGRYSSCADSVHYLGLERRGSGRVAALRRGSAIVRQSSPDVVHTHLFQSDLLGFALRGRHSVPVVSTVHTTGMRRSDPARSRLLARTIGALSRCFSEVVACNSVALSFMEDHGYRAGHPVIDNALLVPTERPSTPTSDDVYLSLARWHPMKDIPAVLDALCLVRQLRPKTRLICAGSGMTPGNEKLSRLIALRGLSGSVELRGAVDDVLPLLRQSRGLIIGSSYGEALPMAGLEAISMGIPVVGTDVGATRDLVPRPELLAVPGDAGSLASAWGWLSGLGPDRYAALRDEVHAIARTRYDIAMAANRYGDLYRALAR